MSPGSLSLSDIAAETTTETNEDLRSKLKRLLAEKLHVSPSEIDAPNFILEYRKQHIYPNMKVDFTSRHGGLNPSTHNYYTESEIEQLRNEIDEFLESLG